MNTKELAKRFLEIADELNEGVSRYFDGSNDAEDIAAYNKVMDAERDFITALNTECGEHYECALNYELAESFLC